MIADDCCSESLLNAIGCVGELARQPLSNLFGRGKSGLRRAECQVTPGGCEPTESAAERRPPKSIGRKTGVTGKGERVR